MTTADAMHLASDIGGADISPGWVPSFVLLAPGAVAPERVT